jgi:hypothetical protein
LNKEEGILLEKTTKILKSGTNGPENPGFFLDETTLTS